MKAALGWEGGLCPLPGHDQSAAMKVYGETVVRGGKRGEACLGAVLEADELNFGCDCYGDPWPREQRRSMYWRPMGEVYWSMRTGNALRPWTRLSASRRFQWRLLLAYRMGLIEPEPVELPPLEDAIERDCRAAHFFALWWGLRRAVEPDLADTAFSVTFVVDALGISRPQAGLAIKALANGLGVLEKTGELDPVGRRKHGTRFYRPKLRAVPAAGNRL